jgi:uncharacterized protein (DUF433 family)
MNAKKYVGLGMYTPAEAAMYARVSTQLITRWIHGSAAGGAAIRAQMMDDAEKTVTFLDLMQAMAIRAIRSQQEASLHAIREAVDFADRHGVTYPFARRHTTYLLGNKILIDVPDSGLVEASGKQRGQQTMKKIVEVYMKDVGFKPDGLAATYTAFEDNGIRIVMHPGYKFGEPVVEPSGHTAWTLWEAVHAEGGIEEAAGAFDVSEQEVRVAYRYIDSIRPATAA